MSETQGNIPVHIGVQQLKIIAFYTILPAFLKWSNNYPLTIEHIRMRDKKWVEFIPAEPDVDAVAEDFCVFKSSKAAAGSDGKKVFRTGQANLMLEIESEKYQEIQGTPHRYTLLLLVYILLSFRFAYILVCYCLATTLL